MDWDLVIAIGGGVFVIAGLLLLSMIHVFMIPKEVLKKDTDEGARGEAQKGIGAWDGAQGDVRDGVSDDGCGSVAAEAARNGEAG